MATITLYKDKVNGVGSLLDDIIKSVNNIDVQLSTLENTLQGVSSSTCDLNDTVESIRSSSKSEQDKVEDLKKLNSKLTEFIETASDRDKSAKDEINKQKEEFYTKYSFLKPECEKSFKEKLCDTVESACEWCKEHWKLIVTVVIVAVAIALLWCGVGEGILAGIIAGACWGAISGAVIGGISGGLDSLENGGSFLDGFENGAFSGALKGALTGAIMGGLGQLGQLAGEGLNTLFEGQACLTNLGKFVKGTSIVTKTLSRLMGTFDIAALADRAFGNGKIADFNKMLHSNKAYNYFQLGIGFTSAFTGGMSRTMKCFTAGTLIAAINGLKAIENIKTGDKVLAAGPGYTAKEYKTVLKTFVKKTNKIIHITANGEEIISTYDHRYYVPGQGFINAIDLCIGSKLIDSENNEIVIENIFREENEQEVFTVYNFKVEDFHTYYVGSTSVLVHNEDYSVPPNSKLSDKLNKLLKKKYNGPIRNAFLNALQKWAPRAAGTNGVKYTPGIKPNYDYEVKITISGLRLFGYKESSTGELIFDLLDEGVGKSH